MARRSRFAWTLSVIVLGIYYSFMAVVAFYPDLLRLPVAEGSATTIGVPLGAAMLVLFWLLTGLYVRRANSDFDALNERLIAESAR